MQKTNKLFLIGAGPGDPELLTLKALKLIYLADVVLYDNLVSDEILQFLFSAPHEEIVRNLMLSDFHKSLTKPELIYVGKKCADKHITQDDINELILEKLRSGKNVARLKGGDPFIFARGVEEMQLAQLAAYEVEIVAGLTSGLSVPVMKGIPLTLRKKSDSVMIVTAHELNLEKIQHWKAFLNTGGTLSVYMALYKLAEIRDLIDMPEISAALIQSGTLKTEKMIRGALQEIPERALEEGFVSPAILVLGRFIELV